MKLSRTGAKGQALASVGWSMRSIFVASIERRVVPGSKASVGCLYVDLQIVVMESSVGM